MTYADFDLFFGSLVEKLQAVGSLLGKLPVRPQAAFPIAAAAVVSLSLGFRPHLHTY